MLALVSLDYACNVLRGKIVPALDDACQVLKDFRVHATLAAILNDLNPAAFQAVAALGAKALLAPANSLSRLAECAVFEMGLVLNLSWNFEEALFNCDEYYEDGMPRIEIEPITWLPWSWDSWDEVLSEVEQQAPEQWSLPIFLLALDQTYGRTNWNKMAETFGWPVEIQPKWWKKPGSDWTLDYERFQAMMKEQGLGKFLTAYECTFRMTENLFMDYDYNENEMQYELPALSVEGVRSLAEVHQKALAILAELEEACELVVETPGYLVNIYNIWAACLEQRKEQRPRTLMQIYEEDEDLSDG